MLHKPALITGAFALVAIFVPSAAADSRDKRTVLTFSEPVEIPGKVLPAGTYVFKLLDSTSSRNIVQIFNKDEDQLHATILALPDYRRNTPEKTIIDFEERASGSPQAIKEWFYPGDNYGVEFVYPHDQAARIAKRTHENVLSMDNGLEKNITIEAHSASAQSVQQMENTEVDGVDPSGNQIDKEQVVTSKPQK